MNKKDVIKFFDSLAPFWDSEQAENKEVTDIILTKGGIVKGADVLDIACGTGILFPEYLSREVNSVTGIDISAEMVKIAKEKSPQINVICGDAETHRFETKFDAVMVYNAFPHFVNSELLFENVSSALKVGGRFSIAHGISEKELQECHSGKAKSVSNPLPDKETLALMMSEFFSVDVMISDDRMYMVSGVKRS